MNKAPRFLFAPVGEVTPAGGDTAAPVDLNTKSTADAVASIFDPEPAAPAAAKPDEKPEPTTETKPAATKPDEPPAKASVFDAMKPKPAATATPPVAAVENPEDKITLSEKAKPETTKQFGELKTITKTLRAELDQAKAALEEAKRTPAVTVAAQQELDRLRAEHKAAMDKLAVVDLKNHPTYTEQFVKPINAAVESVKSVLESYGMNIDVQALLAKPRAEFTTVANEIAAKLGPLDQAAFVQDIRTIRALEAKADAAVKNAGSLSGEIQQQQTAKAKATFSETLANLDFIKAGGLGTVEIPANCSPEDRTYFEGYNASATAIPAEAERIAFGGMGDKDVARVSVEAATFRHMARHVIPRMDAEHKAALARIGELTQALKEMKGSAEAAATDSSAASSGGTKQLHEMSTEEAVAAISRGR